MSKVVHVVLTGGPSGGKSSAKAHLMQQLAARGWRVFFVPEAATMVIGGGLYEIGELAGREDRSAFLDVQRQITSLQLAMHSSFDALARLSGQNAVVLHDRGVLDNAGYLSMEEFTQVVSGLGTTIADASNLYDGVVHLRSAAVVSQGYDGSGYTVANNEARFESADEAAVLDERTLQGWSAHRRLAVIGTSNDFAGKLDTVLNTVLSWIGENGAEEHQRKFVLRSAPAVDSAFRDFHFVDITTTYLVNRDGDEQRVRASTYRGTTSFSHTTKRTVSSELRLETTERISEQTYTALLAFSDPDKVALLKRRWYFVYENVRFSIDHVLSSHQEWVVEVEATQDTSLTWPPYLGAAKEVTGDPSWLSSSRARKVA